MNKFQQQIDALREHVAEIKAKMIAAECPIKVGDVVIVNGFSHEGKKMKVTAVYYKCNYRGYHFCATGMVLKKDGSEGAYRGECIIPINA